MASSIAEGSVSEDRYELYCLPMINHSIVLVSSTLSIAIDPDVGTMIPWHIT